MQKYKSNITTTSGAAVRGVPVLVIDEDGNNAALFLDRAGTVPAPNPLSTASDGTFYFYAENGRYSLRTTVDGVTITDADVALLWDPAEVLLSGPLAEAVERAEASAAQAEAAVADSGIVDLVASAQNAVVDAQLALAEASGLGQAAQEAEDAAASAVLASQVATDAANLAVDAAQDAILASAASIKAYATHAEAAIAAALLPDGADVEISQDETRAGARTRYKVQAGALVFVVNLDQVRQDLAAPTGTGLVGFLQSGSGAVARTLQSKSREVVSITDFGGLDDDSTDNSAAFAAAKTAVGANGTINFPKVHAAGVYYFNTDPGLGGVTLSVDPATSLRGPFALPSTVKVVRDTAARITSGQNYNYRFTPEFGKAAAEKSLYLTDGDLDHSAVLPLDPSAAFALSEKLAFPLADTWVSATADRTAVADQVSWNSVPADGNARVTFFQCRPGDELAVAFSAPGVYRRLAVIKTTNGYYFVYADGNGAAPHFGGKVIGTAAVDNAFTYNGRTKAQYLPENSLWSIRIYDRNTFSVLFNGLEVTGVQTAFGDIISAGFGVQSLSGTPTLYTDGWAMWRTKPAGGKRDIAVLCVGDSLTADIHGGWPYAMREALENSFGIRVNNVINQAVSGANSTSQLSLLTTNGTQGASHVFICIGTNDIQFASSAATLISNIDSMITLCNTNFATPIVWIPPLWYSQSDAGGDGQHTAGIGLGSNHRARIMRLCANRGVKCVDMLQVTGPILGSYLSTASDPFLRDNIHPTTYAYRIIGHRLARALAGSYVPRVSRSLDWAPLTAKYANSWVAGAEPPKVSMDSSGVVHFNGYASGGTVTNGTTMLTLPLHLRPLQTCRFVCANNTTLPCTINVNVDGTMVIYNATGVTFVALDGVSYQTAG